MANEDCISAGIQLAWRNTEKVETERGSGYGKHYVSFRIEIEETNFVKTFNVKMSLENQISVVITCKSPILACMRVSSYLRVKPPTQTHRGFFVFF